MIRYLSVPLLLMFALGLGAGWALRQWRGLRPPRFFVAARLHCEPKLHDFTLSFDGTRAVYSIDNGSDLPATLTVQHSFVGKDAP